MKSNLGTKKIIKFNGKINKETKPLIKKLVKAESGLGSVKVRSIGNRLRNTIKVLPGRSFILMVIAATQLIGRDTDFK